MDRRSQRNHIRAARDWLGQADDSLAQEKDVQGDLKLMLAKAELARMENLPAQGLSLWGRRLLAAALAAVLAGGICYWQAPAPQAPQAPQAVPAGSAAQEMPSVPAVKNSPAAEPVIPAQPEFSAPAVVQPAPEVEKAVPAVQEKPPAAVEKAAPADPPAPPQVPDVNKQQLMQSAGKILRQ